MSVTAPASAPVVGIAGVGLIGASIGLRAVQLGWRTLGWDRSADHLTRAIELGAVDAPATSLRALADASDVLVLAAPPDATLLHLADLAGYAGRARLVIDVASVKAPLRRAAAGVPHFVATHPIAGSERSGPGAARADLFTGRVWTYDAAADPAAARLAVEFVEALGASAFAIGNEDHDRVIAATSHLPQLLSVALGAHLEGYLAASEAAPLCGTGVRSMLRLGSSSWELWRPILALNAAPAAQEVRRVIDVLTGVAEELEEGRLDVIGDRFAAAAGALARLSATNGQRAGEARSEKTAS